MLPDQNQRPLPLHTRSFQGVDKQDDDDADADDDGRRRNSVQSAVAHPLGQQILDALRSLVLIAPQQLAWPQDALWILFHPWRKAVQIASALLCHPDEARHLPAARVYSPWRETGSLHGGDMAPVSALTTASEMLT